MPKMKVDKMTDISKLCPSNLKFTRKQFEKLEPFFKDVSEALEEAIDNVDGLEGEARQLGDYASEARGELEKLLDQLKEPLEILEMLRGDDQLEDAA